MEEDEEDVGAIMRGMEAYTTTRATQKPVDLDGSFFVVPMKMVTSTQTTMNDPSQSAQHRKGMIRCPSEEVSEEGIRRRKPQAPSAEGRGRVVQVR